AGRQRHAEEGLFVRERAGQRFEVAKMTDPLEFVADVFRRHRHVPEKCRYPVIAGPAVEPRVDVPLEEIDVALGRSVALRGFPIAIHEGRFLPAILWVQTDLPRWPAAQKGRTIHLRPRRHELGQQERALT